MARRTVFVPDSLHKRMAKLDGENWSGIAAQAFEERVRELEPKDPSGKASESSPLSVAYALGKLASMTMDIASADQPLRKRLVASYRKSLITVLESDFPGEFSGLYRKIKKQLSDLAIADNRGQALAAVLHDDVAARLAEEIVSLYGDLCRFHEAGKRRR